MLLKFPPTTSESQKRNLKRQIHDWCLAKGVLFANRQSPGEGHTVPVTLFPTPFSRHGFETAMNIQISYNSLYHAVVNNPDFVVEELTKASGTEDKFTLNLLNIYKNTVKTRTQNLTGGLFRSDYLVDKMRSSLDEGRQIKQVEFNTVSVSFGSLSSRVTEMHKFLALTAKNSIHGEVPVSTSLKDLAKGLATMHNAYRNGTNEAIVLIITQPDEANVMDQRLLEYELYEKYGIICVRASLEQVHRKTAIGKDNRLIFVPNGMEVSVVYYRAGYGPHEYPTDAEWAARERLESSHAIQCPSVLTQLAGSKKIQQLLTINGVIEKLHPNLEDSEIASIRKTFVEMWPLDDSELGRQGQKHAMENPERYVLKPQREGGGNNIYREDIPEYLNKLDRQSWSNYVLMELIDSPKISNIMLKGNELITGRIVNELGVFGTVLWDLDTGKEVMNNVAGFLLRTKLQSSNEGGVAAGFGCLDAILLPSR